jgi:N-acetylglutamate synthase-like GNAT family acetyltransferase
VIDDHITSLGYDVTITSDVELARTLIEAVGLEVVEENGKGWPESSYLVATTRAGGSAATVGWSLRDDMAVLHSLVVAPAMRGSGLGAGALAAAVSHIMDTSPVTSIGLATESHRAKALFRTLGFTSCDPSELPAEMLDHPSIERLGSSRMTMMRDYSKPKRGLDQTAFCLILNDTPDATLPLGSVFFFSQTGQVIEARYRGGTVVRGHLLGSIQGQDLNFVWHQYLTTDDFQTGKGHIELDVLPDGRRELREMLGGTNHDQSLLLREV